MHPNTPALSLLQRSTHRISFTAPDHVWQKLNNCSLEQGRSVSNLVAYLVEHCLHSVPAPSRDST